jgi:hypothetical protein
VSAINIGRVWMKTKFTGKHMVATLWCPVQSKSVKHSCWRYTQMAGYLRHLRYLVISCALYRKWASVAEVQKCDEHFATSFMDTAIDTVSLTDRLVLWYAISRVKPHSSQDGCWNTDISICFHVRYWCSALGDAAPSPCHREPVLCGCSGTNWHPQQQEVFLGTCNGW